MKFNIMASIITFSVISTAGFSKLEGHLLYERAGTTGEGAEKFVSGNKQQTIQLRKAPSLLHNRNHECVLKAKTTIGFSELIQVKKFGEWEAVKDGAKFIMLDINGVEHQIDLRKGEKVLDAGDYGEGWRVVGVGEKNSAGNTVRINFGDTDEFGDDESTSNAAFKKLSEAEVMEWYFVSCKNTTGWALKSELENVPGMKKIQGEF